MGSKGDRLRIFGSGLRSSRYLKAGIKWAITGVASLSTVCIGLLPAISAELSSWRYDSRSRSLTLTLPGTTVPNVSVTAPDQLLVELPDTQIGDVRWQRVNDGFVEQIALEQATPETVWMVVDFVPGTVLSETQQATPLAASSNAIQLWKVEPTLLASRRVVDAAIASQPDSAPSGGAAALESPRVGSEVAQADFPDLPVLEPAVPQNQTVVVPPISAAPVRVPDVTAPVVEIPVLEADVTEATSPAPPTLPAVNAEPLAPAAPPFIGEVDEIAAEPNPTQDSASGIEVAVEVARDEIAGDREAIANSRFESDARSEDSGFVPPSASERASSESRWPEPIPFGQPLP